MTPRRLGLVEPVGALVGAGAGAGTAADAAAPAGAARTNANADLAIPANLKIDKTEALKVDGRQHALSQVSVLLGQLIKGISATMRGNPDSRIVPPQSLPGKRAWRLLAPWWTTFDTQPNNHDSFKNASVMIALYPVAGQLFFPLAVRSSELRLHPGQISLPGGTLHPGETIAAAALRETQEELGISTSAIEVIGYLSPFVLQRSGFIVYPVVGFMEHKPECAADGAEIVDVIEANLAHFADFAHLSSTRISLGDAQECVPCYAIQDRIIWGATAMILSELGMIVREAQ